MPHSYYSQRAGLNPHPDGLPLRDVVDLFVRVYGQLVDGGFFDQAFGSDCEDAGFIHGSVPDVDLEIRLAIHKTNLWPIHEHSPKYSEDDFFDVIEFLFQHISKPMDSSSHGFNNHCMHWSNFNRAEGRAQFCDKVNYVLGHYERAFELSPNGDVLQKPEQGFEHIFRADLPSGDPKIVDRVNAAILRFRRHGSTIDDRRQAVRDLADVFEYLRPTVQQLLTSRDESDLFNLANNFGVRHHNDQQKTNYDTALWLAWMFYFYLATVHLVLRKLQIDRSSVEPEKCAKLVHSKRLAGSTAKNKN